jgi:iron complex outermembrane receptor protein
MLYQHLLSKDRSIERASAQYGSDAIAGVININVKKATNKFDIALCGKPNFKGSNDHRGGNDGNNAQVDMNYGTSLGKEKVSSMQLQVFN